MATSGLTPRERKRGRNSFLIFELFNVISFTTLSGSVLTLFSLRLGADSFFIGLLSAVMNIGLLLMLVGRQTIRRVGVKNQWGFSWLLRNIAMTPILFAPAASAAGNTTAALLLVFFSMVGFHSFKGTGMVSNDPMVGSLSEGKDRGAFLARAQIYVQTMLIATNLFVSFFLGPDARLSRYLVLICAGMAAGLLSTIFIFRMPEPSLDTPGPGNTLFAVIRRSMKRPEFRYFIALASLVALINGLANPFIIVYAKKIYGLADNLVVLFLVIGNLSVIIMGLIARKLIDRLGAKALYLIFLGILCVAVILIIGSPPLGKIGVFVFLGLLFFLYNFGQVGGANSQQNYFYTITDTNERLNFGLLNHVLSGTAGAVGSIAGGLLLHGMEATLPNPVNAFRFFYLIILLLLLACFPLIIKLRNVGAFSIRSALEIFLSLKNLRTIALLHKLDTSTTVDEEARVIDSLAESDSPVAVKDILARLTSPRFFIRSRALRALENLPLTDEVADALITQVRRHAFTTAHTAARIMGRKKVEKGVRVLRQSLSSEDYLLQAEATLALAHLGDRQSIPKIESILSNSRVPLVQIYAAAALDIMKSTSSLPYLFNAMNQKNSPPYFRDEIILSIADLLGIGDWFYGFYSQFLDHALDGIEGIIDYMKDCGVDPETLSTVSDIIRTLQSNRRAFSRRMAERLSNQHGDSGEIITHLIDIARNGSLMRFDRLAFLMAAVLARLECGAMKLE
ncbi:MAG: MFS transporter [Spirochaetales bacterium]|nr:MFS transporter [Spirochaetales bacterium]